MGGGVTTDMLAALRQPGDAGLEPAAWACRRRGFLDRWDRLTDAGARVLEFHKGRL